MINIFDINFQWIQSGITSGSTGLTWIQVPSLEPYENVTDLRENYFNYQKCTSGVCYQYVTELDDIYQKNINVGNNNYIKNFYNEFDLIEEFMKNFTYVDICVDDEIDTTKRYTRLDNILLKSNNRILIKNQSDKTKNGIYQISNSGLLEPTDDLSTTDKSFRFSTQVKNGTYKDKQLFLINSGNSFPTTYENKEFIEKRSYIIKNKFWYNMEQTGTTSDIVPKLLFTDYEIARKSFTKNSEYYDDTTLTTSISYDNYTHILAPKSQNGSISLIKTYSGHTLIEGNSGSFSSNEFILLEIVSGDTILKYHTYIYDVVGSDVLLSKNIPTEILESLKIQYPSSTYYLYKNKGSNMEEIINNGETPFSDFLFYSGTTLYAKDSVLNHYINFDSVSIDGNPLTTDNFYITYNLFNHLNAINSTVFSSSYPIIDSSSLSITSTGITSGNTLMYIYSTDTEGFYPYTFSYVNSAINTLIKEVSENEYVILEIPIGYDSGSTISSLDNINQLEDISDILNDVYLNSGTTYYRKRSDNERRIICGAYGEILSNNIDIQTGTTGIVLQNENDIFELRLFNVESYENNGLNSGSTTMDKNMTYRPVDLLKIGYDKKTRFPIPIFQNNIQVT